MRISDALVIKLLTNSKSVSQDKVEELKKHEAADKKAMQYLAIKDGLISEEDLTKLYAEEIDIPFIDLDVGSITEKCLSLMPKRVAKKYKAVVFETKDDGSLLVAMEDPEDVQSVIYLRKILSSKLKLFVATETKVNKAIARIKVDTGPSSKQIDKSESHAEVTADSLIRTINQIVDHGIKSNATDVHIEPRNDVIVIRYRIDGSLREHHKLPLNMLTGLLDQIKLISGLSSAENRLPQNGKFKYEDGNQTRTISVSTIPVLDGEKVVFRIINESSNPVRLETLGLWGDSLRQLNKIIAKPRGLILACGPIDSGRSTTLFSILSKLYTPTLSIATIEDPIIRRFTGANQTAVNSSNGITFATGLKAILEHNPNIILVGELRDVETAEIVMHASQRGHLILSSLFSPSAVTALNKLKNLGVEEHQTASSLNGVIAQRLVKRLCPFCAIAILPGRGQIKQLREDFGLGASFKAINDLEKKALSEGIGADSNKSLSSGAFTVNKLWTAKEGGCGECNYTGYNGRIGLFEVLTNSDEMTKLIATNKDDSAMYKLAVSEGMISMKIDGLIKALRGLTTLEEVLSATSDS